MKVQFLVCRHPGNNPLTKGEKIIVNLANEDGGILDSETLHRTLIQHGISSPIARQVVIHTPLLFSIKKGHYRQKGLYKFVGNLDAPLVEGSQEHRTSEDFLIQIKVESKTRMLGRVSITEKLPKEGEYDVYDQDDNFICVLQYQGVTLSGLRPLLKDTDAQTLSLRFEASSGCFIAE